MAPRQPAVRRSPSSGTRRHIPALDGVRGAAVAAVLLFHAGHLAGGWLGVDLFFVLSGFLITTLLLEEHSGRGAISLPAFWARRARRLLPALLLVLLGVGLYALLWAAPRELSQIRADGLATLGYVANWHQIAGGHSYWDLFRAPSPLQHTWSLAIEEQFYLVWPLIVVGVLAWRRSIGAVLAASVVGVAASFVTMLVLYRPGADPQRVYLGTDTRASSILIGASVAAVVASRGWSPRLGRRAFLEGLGLLGIGVLAWAWLSLPGTTPALYEGVLLGCSAAGALLIAAAAHPRQGLIARALSFRPLAALGVISYGVYLWHWPVYLVVDEARTGLHGWTLTGLRVAITLAIAATSYRLVESPIRRGALAGRRIGILTPVAAVAAAAAIVATTIPPAVSRASPEAALGRLAVGSPPGSSPVAGAVNASGTSQPFHLMVTGDSIAVRLVPALRAFQGPGGYTVTDRTSLACALQRGATGRRLAGASGPLNSPDCSAGWAEEVRRDHPDVVFVSLAGQVLGQWRIGGRWLGPCDAGYARWFEDQLLSSLPLLTARGARVALALPAPALTPEFARGTACVHAIEAKLASRLHGVAPMDFERLVCPHGRCLNDVDGILLREDGFHYTGAGADLVVRWLAPRLRTLATSPAHP